MARNTINEMREALQQERAVRTTSKRKCATCGKPTTDYRCDACWNKLRGEGDQGEGRRQKPITNKMQADPWKPLTVLPVTFVPDRQAEFFARQAAKQKEATMNTTPETQQAPRTYTMKELAALAGVPVRDIYDAKKNQHKALLSAHSGRGKVVACMQEHGITWAQVQGRNIAASTPSTEAPQAAAPGADGGPTPACVPAEQPVNKNNVDDIARRLDALFAGVSLETAAKASAAALTRIGVNKNPGEVAYIRTVAAYSGPEGFPL